MHISCLNQAVAETEFESIYQEMNRRGSILFVHPSVTGICSPFITDYGYTASVGTSLEDATFVLHMLAKQSDTAIRTSNSSCCTSADPFRCC
jgi:6-methylsalicylate decarboxylase